jgi:hypothetical protein
MAQIYAHIPEFQGVDKNGMYEGHFNMRSGEMFDKGKRNQDADAVPPNVHGSKPFVIKMQNTVSRSPMMMHDRARSFVGGWNRHTTSEVVAFDKVDEVIKTGAYGMKVFMWARRVGPWELSVALNKLPDQNLKW